MPFRSIASPSPEVLSAVLSFAGVRTVSPGSLKLPALQPIYCASLDGRTLDSILPVSAEGVRELLTYQPQRHLLIHPTPQEAGSVTPQADGSVAVPLVSVDSWQESEAASELRLGGEFDLRQFRQYREARVLGGCLLYSAVMESSWDLIAGLLSRLPANSGLLIVSGVQLRGRGRDQNVWLAPPGCAQLSLHLSLPAGSPLASKPSLLQHVAALAVLKGLRSVPGCGDLDLKIKWPNDVHLPGKGKVAGILVKASASRDWLSAAIGIGVNVTNRSPGTCLAAAFDEAGRPTPPALTSEVAIARIVTELEALVQEFQFDAFRKLYTDNWMHSDQVVSARLAADSASTSSLTISCQIVGIDEAGFLRVRDLKSGRCLSLHPDGNSFDMSRGLLVPK